MLADGGIALAGGTDLVSLLRDGHCAPEALIDIKHSDVPDGISSAAGGVRIGALTTLTDIELDQTLRRRYPLLCEAAEQTATRQLRNRATLGGNLLQESRCWYFRHPDLVCWLQGGAECYAKSGRHERHAIAASQDCISVHPSDLAGCLIALDATVKLVSNDDQRTLPLAEFLTCPAESHRSHHSLRNGELITEVYIPDAAESLRSTYLKAMSRKAWTFALAGVAAAIHVEERGVTRSRIVLNGIAPEPLLLKDPTVDGPLSFRDTAARLSADLENRAAPLPGNAYKVPLAKGLIEEAIDKLTE